MDGDGPSPQTRPARQGRQPNPKRAEPTSVGKGVGNQLEQPPNEQGRTDMGNGGGKASGSPERAPQPGGIGEWFPNPRETKNNSRGDDKEQESAYGRRLTSFLRYPDRHRADFDRQRFARIQEVAHELHHFPRGRFTGRPHQLQERHSPLKAIERSGHMYVRATGDPLTQTVLRPGIRRTVWHPPIG